MAANGTSMTDIATRTTGRLTMRGRDRVLNLSISRSLHWANGVTERTHVGSLQNDLQDKQRHRRRSVTHEPGSCSGSWLPISTAIRAGRAVLGVPLRSGAAHVVPFGPVGVEQCPEREDEVGAGEGDRATAAVQCRACPALPGHDTSLVLALAMRCARRSSRPRTMGPGQTRGSRNGS
jgi:hypothetical protein